MQTPVLGSYTPAAPRESRVAKFRPQVPIQLCLRVVTLLESDGSWQSQLTCLKMKVVILPPHRAGVSLEQDRPCGAFIVHKNGAVSNPASWLLALVKRRSAVTPPDLCLCLRCPSLAVHRPNFYSACKTPLREPLLAVSPAQPPLSCGSVVHGTPVSGGPTRLWSVLRPSAPPADALVAASSSLHPWCLMCRRCSDSFLQQRCASAG